MAGDRGDVDDRALAAGERRRERARQGERREEIELEHRVPIGDVAVEAAEPLAERRLGRDAGIVDERVERAVADEPRRLLGEALDLGRIAKVGRDVVRPVGIALAFGRHVLARGGDDVPAGGAEALHRRMADAAACAGEEQGFARGSGHGGSLREETLDRPACALAAIGRGARAAGAGAPPRIRSASARCGSRTSSAAAARRVRRSGAIPRRIAARARPGWRAGAIAPRPRRRSGFRARATRNRHRPRHRPPVAPPLRCAIAASALSSESTTPRADWPKAPRPCGFRRWYRTRNRANRRL